MSLARFYETRKDTIKLTREAFKTDKNYESYLRGWKSSAAETRLDNDTSWD